VRRPRRRRTTSSWPLRLARTDTGRAIRGSSPGSVSRMRIGAGARCRMTRASARTRREDRMPSTADRRPNLHRRILHHSCSAAGIRSPPRVVGTHRARASHGHSGGISCLGGRALTTALAVGAARGPGAAGATACSGGRGVVMFSRKAGSSVLEPMGHANGCYALAVPFFSCLHPTVPPAWGPRGDEGHSRK
jgi:hypothetical protein